MTLTARSSSAVTLANMIAWAYATFFLLGLSELYVQRVADILLAYRILKACGVPASSAVGQAHLDLEAAETHARRSRASRNLLAQWKAVMMSLTSEWTSFLVVDSIMLILSAFLLRLEFLGGSHLSAMVATLRLLGTITTLSAVVITSIFRAHAQGLLMLDDVGTALSWAKAATKHSSSRLLDLSILSAVPAASTAWSLTFLLTSIFLSIYEGALPRYCDALVHLWVSGISNPESVALPGAGPFHALPPLALVFVTTFTALTIVHGAWVCTRFIALGSKEDGMRDHDVVVQPLIAEPSGLGSGFICAENDKNA